MLVFDFPISFIFNSVASIKRSDDHLILLANGHFVI